MSLDARPPHPLLPTDYSVGVGTILRRGVDVFRIIEWNKEIAILENCRAIARKQIPSLQLLGAIEAGDIQFSSEADEARALTGDNFNDADSVVIDGELPLDGLSEAQQRQFRRVTRYIRELQRRGYLSLTPSNKLIQLELDRLRQRFNDPEPVRAAWVYKWWLEIKRSGGDNRAAIPKFNRRGGRGGHRLDSIAEEAICRVIQRTKNDKTLKIRTRSMADGVNAILRIEHPERDDLKFSVSWSTMDRRIREAFTEYEICVRNKGRAYARRKYREWFPRDRAQFPLEVVETDDTDTQIFLIDELTGLPRGRGYLTAVIDQHSDTPMGWELSDKPRSMWSAVSSLVHAILPKNPDHSDFGECTSGCEFYGRPGIVVFDNALYNHCDEIELAAESMRFIPAWAKPKTPTEKAMVEGWFKTLKTVFLPSLPGFRGSKTSRDDIKEGMATANMGWLEFRKALIKWAFDEFANKPQLSGWTPRQRWHAGMRFASPLIPRDIRGFKLNACLHQKLKFRPEGIQLAPGLIYSHPELGRLRRQYGHNSDSKFRYHPQELGSIAVLDPGSNTYIQVPSVNPEYTHGLSLYQHKLILQMAKENGIRNPSARDLMLYREMLRVLTEQLRHSKKLRERIKSARTGDVPGGESTGTYKPGAVVVVTELEARIEEFAQIPMEEGDDGWTLPRNI
jgi:putative transposase